MVNKKPSTGCAACRSRHIKCDETRPGCKRCALKKISCPGYRDVKGVIFVNRTDEITSRHVRRSKSAGTSPEAPSPSTCQDILKPHVPLSMDIDHDAAAIGFFFSQHVMSPNRGMLTSRAHMEYLIPLYTRSKPDSALALATAAMAYQALAVSQGIDTYRLRQAKYMADACQRLQQAVRHPEESLQDETLMAVLCLDFAEHVLSREGSRASCRAHVDGASALIKHRPVESFQSDIAQSLYATTRSNVLLQALWFGDAQGVVDFPKIDIGPRNPVTDFQHILARALTLEHDVLVVDTPSAAELDRRRLLAAKLDVELDLWWLQMPSLWLTVVTRPLPPADRSVAMVQAANLVGQWHCLKVLVLKLVCATSDDEATVQMVPLDVELTLQRLCLVCEYLTDTANTTRIEDMAVVEKTMDRTTSARVVASRGGTMLNVGLAPTAQNYHVNILRWILDEIHEPRMDKTKNFAFPSNSTRCLEDQWTQALATFSPT